MLSGKGEDCVRGHDKVLDDLVLIVLMGVTGWGHRKEAKPHGYGLKSIKSNRFLVPIKISGST